MGAKRTVDRLKMKLYAASFTSSVRTVRTLLDIDESGMNERSINQCIHIITCTRVSWQAARTRRARLSWSSCLVHSVTTSSARPAVCLCANCVIDVAWSTKYIGCVVCCHLSLLHYLSCDAHFLLITSACSNACCSSLATLGLTVSTCLTKSWGSPGKNLAAVLSLSSRDLA